MLKTLSFCSLLLVLALGSSQAETYRCKDADGIVIFTDNPANVPPGCQPEVVKGLPSDGVSASGFSQPIKQRATTQRPTATTEQRQQQSAESAFDTLKNEAESLVEQFVVTRRRVFRSILTKDKLQARRELKEIRVQKSSLLSEIDQSSLNRSERKEIKAVLSSITER